MINTLNKRFILIVTLFFLTSCASRHDFCQNEKVDLTVNDAKCFNGYQLVKYISRNKNSNNYNNETIGITNKRDNFSVGIFQSSENQIDLYTLDLGNIEFGILPNSDNDALKKNIRHIMYSNKNGNTSIDMNSDGIVDIIGYKGKGKDRQIFRLYKRQMYLTNRDRGGCAFINKKWVKLDFDYDLGEFVINKSYVCKKTKLN